MFDSRTHVVMVSRSSSANPNLARTGAACARLSSWLAVARVSAMVSSSAATESSGLVWVRARSARRTRSRCAGWQSPATSPRPKPATINGA
ncbi:Uncharacterised protein [Mycobacterium tuberculosis]|uniref:Uncharacterized protein n=1 Tax=Mycobacterium tuberculosis TaxID=1773 RepID=A0A0T9DY28_MYCTX|nr:Uncharacterised protein [Mycobacterium tuberculosis]CKS69818.1 Uncharacterised protein [Mycobacterium tuberculosis]CKT33282.1 Uncharacterised protein [Mycobacterium tuberculosis]CKT59324.1 Uncharacterised protein [Mycobacterium tuberculosis]CNM49866.1 Uncharacterised protein [Mycobacterium tuberculosis]